MTPTQPPVHTPGPWTVRNNGPHWNNPAIVNFDICWSPDGERVAEHVYEEADARLIAAAPDMDAALRAFVDAHDMAETEPDRMLVGMQMGCAYEMARAAIAKATGATP